MEASKLLVDVVVYAGFFGLLRFYLLDYKFSKHKLLKFIALGCYCVITVVMWIYTYAVIGYAVAELIGARSWN